MSEVRQWPGFAPDLGAGVSYCPKCRCPIVNTEVARQAHEDRVHRERIQLVRFLTTPEVVTEKRQGRPPARRKGDSSDEDESFSCAACRDGDHLLCDGDECRCVCALELDEPKRKFQISY